MINKSFRNLRPFLICGAVAMMSCSGNSGPGQKDVASYVSGRLPVGVSLKDFQHKNFMNQQQGTGRASVGGQLEVNVDHYKQANDVFISDLRSAGLSGAEIAYFARGQERENIYAISTKSGTVVPFSAELEFHSTVDGFRFGGSLEFNLNGMSQPSLQRGALVVGTQEYRAAVESVVENKRRLMAERQENRVVLERFLLPGGVYKVSQVPQEWRSKDTELRGLFDLQISQPISWVEDTDRPDILRFSVIGNSTWLRDGGWANSGFKNGDRISMMLDGYIAKEAVVGFQERQWRTLLVIAVPDPNAPGRYYNTGNRMKWDGAAFVSDSGGAKLAK